MASGLTVVAMMVVAWLTRDSWFYGDYWDFFLERDLADIASLLKPHNRHLQVSVALLHQALYETVGLEFAWFGALRVVGYGVMTFVMWIVLRRRGAEPEVAWIALVVLLVLGASGVLNSTSMGAFLVLPAVAVAASILDGGGPRSARESVFLGVLIVGMVITTSSGIAATAAIAVVSVAAGRIRHAALPVLAGVAVYGLWLVSFQGDNAGARLPTLETVAAIPGSMIRMVGAAAARTLVLPSSWAGFVAVVLIALVAIWFRQGRLTKFDAVWLLMSAAYIVMVTVVRVGTGRQDPENIRFGFILTWLIVPALVPHIRLPSNDQLKRVVIVAALVFLGVGNLLIFSQEADRWEVVSRETRDHLSAVASLLLEGEPAVSEAELEFPEGGEARRGFFTVAGVREFLGTGWEPQGEYDADAIERARGILRFHVVRGGAGSGCVRVFAGQTHVVAAGAQPVLVLRSIEEVSARILHEDDWGSGFRELQFVGGQTVTHLGDAAATISIAVTEGGPLRVCTPAG